MVIAELLKRDPVLLARKAGIEPDPWQVSVLRSQADRLLLNCCRQSGKSTITSILALHTALYQPGSLILMLAAAERQAGELFKKFLAAYQMLGRPVPTKSESALQLELANGSRVVALPGKEATVRSFSSVRLLLIDEASRVPDDLYRAVRPMLAVSAGRLIGLSSPFGKRGWWYEAWESTEGWERYEVPATQCPRISAEFLADEKLALPPFWFEQEYGCLFCDSVNGLFTGEDLVRAQTEAVVPLFA